MEAKETLVLVLRRGPDVELRIVLREFKGEYYVDFPTWWKPPGSEEFKPTKRGPRSRSRAWTR